jgi:hypothetical protein
LRALRHNFLSYPQNGDKNTHITSFTSKCMDLVEGQSGRGRGKGNNRDSEKEEERHKERERERKIWRGRERERVPRGEPFGGVDVVK